MIPVLFHQAIQRDTLTENSPWDVRTKRDSNGLPRMEMKVYNGTGGSLVAKQWYEIRYDGDEETNPRLAAVASGAATGLTNKYVCVATEAAADTAWTWVVIWGYYDAFVEGTTDVAKDDYLKFDTSVETEAPIKDGTTPTRLSVAIACEAQATAGVATDALVFILGERVGVDA
jgi:hypothetical protein